MGVQGETSYQTYLYPQVHDQKTAPGEYDRGCVVSLGSDYDRDQAYHLQVTELRLKLERVLLDEATTVRPVDDDRAFPSLHLWVVELPARDEGRRDPLRQPAVHAPVGVPDSELAPLHVPCFWPVPVLVFRGVRDLLGFHVCDDRPFVQGIAQGVLLRLPAVRDIAIPRETSFSPFRERSPLRPLGTFAIAANET